MQLKRTVQIEAFQGNSMHFYKEVSTSWPVRMRPEIQSSQDKGPEPRTVQSTRLYCSVRHCEAAYNSAPCLACLCAGRGQGYIDKTCKCSNKKIWERFRRKEGWSVKERVALGGEKWGHCEGKTNRRKKDGRSVTFSLPGRLRCEQLMTQTTVRSIHFTDLFTSYSSPLLEGKLLGKQSARWNFLLRRGLLYTHACGLTENFTPKVAKRAHVAPLCP